MSSYRYSEGVKMWDKYVPFADNTIEQLHKVARMPFIHKHVAAMPDAHLGIGATVGSVIATKGAVIPAAVGVDLGCLDADTEFLSPNGWMRMADWDDHKVMQFCVESETASFVVPQNYIAKPCNKMYHIKTKYGLDMMVSEDHRILYYRAGRKRNFTKYDVVPASVLVEKHNKNTLGFGGFIRTDFKLTEDDIVLSLEDCLLIRLGVAIAADAFEDSSKTLFRLKKERKINRLKTLLDYVGIEFTEKQRGNGVTEISFYTTINKLDGLVNWGDSIHALKVKYDEIFHWDGNMESKCFYTRKKEEADFVQYMIGACGLRSVMREDTHKGDGKIDYRVFANENIKVGLKGNPNSIIKEVVPDDGMQYCFTVPTSFFVARRNGKTFITGNCGMQAVKTSLKAEDLPDNLRDLRMDIERSIPLGFQSVKGRYTKGSWEVTPASVASRMRPLNQRLELLMDKHPALSKNKAHLQMGSLGGGNHFIEICLDEADKVWVMLHSGSRGAGNMIGRHFIEKAKQDMRVHFINLPDKDLSYLSEGTQHFDDYIEAVDWAQEYASENRNTMMDIVLRIMSESLPSFKLGKMAVNCHHNYISRENHFGDNVIVTRKGAIRARKDELGIIPSSMATGSAIVRGLGNKDSFCSCSHGSGRVMSRTEAKKLITLDDHIKATQGVECRKDKDVIDESPSAYKDFDAVMRSQADLVTIEHRIKQVLNIKG